MRRGRLRTTAGANHAASNSASPAATEALLLPETGVQPMTVHGITIDHTGQHVPKYEPTPDEIAADAAAIRAGWSEREERKRTRRSEPYEVPKLRVIR